MAEGLKRKIYKSRFLSSLKERWFFIFYLGGIILLASGFFNFLLEGSKPQYATSIILRSRSIQNLLETLTNIIILLMGFGGAYLIYQGGRQIRESTFNLYSLLGLFLIFLALLLIFIIFNLKS
ncbi:hypothetical protein HRbin06_00831 [archaeon HR06]|nr:hypothetical protein HRbin06_00831 [archaeon HR06]